MQLSSYSKVWALSHMQAQGLFEGPVVVQEKVDGSQFSFGNLGGQLHCRSKGQQVGPGGNQEGMFEKAVRTADLVFRTGTIPEGMGIRSEYLAKPHHNTLAYGRVPIGYILLWDISEKDGSEMYLPPRAVREWADKWGLEVSPTFFEGSLTAHEALRLYLEEWSKRPSLLGGPIEGVVIKNYKKCDGFGKMLAAKIVADDFKEQNAANWDAQKQGAIIDRIISTFNKEAIWEKAIQHARDDGQLANEAKDIGPLIGAIKKDFGLEHHDYIAKRLVKEFYSDIERGVMRGFPEWYKKKLLEQMLSKEKTDAAI